MHPSWLTRGNIVKCWVDDLDDPERPEGGWKRFVVVGFDKDVDLVRMVLINTRVSEDFDRKHSEYMPAQIHIRKSDYNRALDYDSWIDCFQLRKIGRKEVAFQLKKFAPKAEALGVLKQGELDKVLYALNKFADLSLRERRIINGPIPQLP